MVNCNETYPQVIRPTGDNIGLSLTNQPPAATQTSHELWWTVCKNQPLKYTEQNGIASVRLQPRETVEFSVGKTQHRITALPLGDLAAVSGLAKIELNNGRSGGPSDIAFVYCSASVPTVAWSDGLIELSVVDDDRYSRTTSLYSRAVYEQTCGSSVAALGSNQSPTSLKSAGPPVFYRQRHGVWSVVGRERTCKISAPVKDGVIEMNFSGATYNENRPLIDPSFEMSILTKSWVGRQLGRLLVLFIGRHASSSEVAYSQEDGAVSFKSDGQGGFLDAWRKNSEMVLLPSNGERIVVSLRGSDAAFRSMFNCLFER